MCICKKTFEVFSQLIELCFIEGKGEQIVAARLIDQIKFEAGYGLHYSIADTGLYPRNLALFIFWKKLTHDCLQKGIFPNRSNV